MKQRRNHRISDWLYHTEFFPSLYGHMAGRFAVDILWDDLLTKFLRRIPNGGTILEVGAGPGLLAIRILETRPSLNIVVTDYSPKMLALARANLAKVSKNNTQISMRHGQVEFVEANAMDLSKFANHTINGIYSMGAIKHFPEPLNCLHQVFNVLADDGMMYISDSCADGTYSGTKMIVEKLNLSPIASKILCPLIHFGLKGESPSASEVSSWCGEFRGNGELEVEFSWNRSMFTLMSHKSLHH